MRKALREVKNVMLQFNEIELKVREATNNDRFMVSNNQLATIARATNDYQYYPSLFAMLWKRLTDLEHVMHVTKALGVVEYLLRHGAERFINDAKRRARDIAALQKYKHYDENNQDDAKEARARAKAVYALLMDDQLLAQERGKSARLASEGRLGGAGHEAQGHAYDDEYADEEAYHAPPPVRRAPSHAANGAASVPAGGPKSGVVRRRSVDEDPFTNPVIPSATVGGAGGTPSKPRTKAAPSGSAQGKGTTSAKHAEAADVDEPASDEEQDEAARKAAKKAKKKAKKEAEAKAAAAALEAENARAAKALQKGGGASSSASPPATRDRTGTLDLMASYGQPDHAQNGGEIDILTGQRSGFSGNGGGAVGELSDLFAGQSLHDSPPFFASHNGGGNGQAGGNPFLSPDPAASSGAQGSNEGQNSSFEEEGFNGGAYDGSSNQQRSGAEAGKNNMHSPTGNLVNLNDLLGPVPKHSKKESVDSGVSMSMMRSIQPLGAPPKQGPADPMAVQAKKRSNVPSSIPLAPSQPQSYSLQGFMAGPGVGPPVGGPYGAPGMGGGYPGMGGPPLGPVGYPHGHAPPPALGPPLGHPGMYGGHPGMHPGMQYGHPQAPMLALMPPGAGQIPYGAAPPGPHAHPGSLPFAAPSPSSNTYTQMRQAPKNLNGAPIFDVVEAQARPVEPVNYLGGGGGGHGHQRNGSQEYQSYYGKPNSAASKVNFDF